MCRNLQRITDLCLLLGLTAQQKANKLPVNSYKQREFLRSCVVHAAKCDTS